MTGGLHIIARLHILVGRWKHAVGRPLPLLSLSLRLFLAALLFFQLLADSLSLRFQTLPLLSLGLGLTVFRRRRRRRQIVEVVNIIDIDVLIGHRLLTVVDMTSPPQVVEHVFAHPGLLQGGDVVLIEAQTPVRGVDGPHDRLIA